MILLKYVNLLFLLEFHIILAILKKWIKCLVYKRMEKLNTVMLLMKQVDKPDEYDHDIENGRRE